jgi:hypothetical protein
METQKSIFKILLAFLIISILAFIVSLNWMGCKTEEIVNTGPPPVIDATLLGGKVVLADYMGDSIPLYNVKVEVVNGPTFYTDSNGTYWLTNISYGKHIVKYSKEGYTSFFTEIDTANFRTGIASIFLAKVITPVLIGPEGGIIQNHKMTLIIPPGALSSYVPISLNSNPVSASLKPNVIPLDLITIYPENLELNKSLILNISTPEYFQNLDSVRMESYNLNAQNYQWENSNFATTFYQDSIRVIINPNNDQSTVIVSSPFVPSFLAYYEFTLGTWTYSSTISPPYLVTPIHECAGNGTSPGSVAGESFAVTITVSVSAGVSYVVTGSVSASIGTTQTVTFPPVPIPVCKCIDFTRTTNEEIYSAPLKVRYCTLTIHGYACTPWTTHTVTKTKYSGVQSAVTETHNNIPECHNQGGN